MTIEATELSGDGSLRTGEIAGRLLETAEDTVRRSSLIQATAIETDEDGNLGVRASISSWRNSWVVRLRDGEEIEVHNQVFIPLDYFEEDDQERLIAAGEAESQIGFYIGNAPHLAYIKATINREAETATDLAISDIEVIR